MPIFYSWLLTYPAVRYAVTLPAQVFHTHLIRSTIKPLCAVVINPRKNIIKVDEAASVIKPASVKYVVTMAKDLTREMKNGDRALHVPIVSIDGHIVTVWCLSPGIHSSRTYS